MQLRTFSVYCLNLSVLVGLLLLFFFQIRADEVVFFYFSQKKLCDIRVWYLNIITDDVFSGDLNDGQSHLKNSIETLVLKSTEKPESAMVNCNILDLYNSMLKEQFNYGSADKNHWLAHTDEEVVGTTTDTRAGLTLESASDISTDKSDSDTTEKSSMEENTKGTMTETHRGCYTDSDNTEEDAIKNVNYENTFQNTKTCCNVETFIEVVLQKCFKFGDKGVINTVKMSNTDTTNTMSGYVVSRNKQNTFSEHDDKSEHDNEMLWNSDELLPENDILLDNEWRLVDDFDETELWEEETGDKLIQSEEPSNGTFQTSVYSDLTIVSDIVSETTSTNSKAEKELLYDSIYSVNIESEVTRDPSTSKHVLPETNKMPEIQSDIISESRQGTLLSQEDEPQMDSDRANNHDIILFTNTKNKSISEMCAFRFGMCYLAHCHLSDVFHKLRPDTEEINLDAPHSNSVVVNVARPTDEILVNSNDRDGLRNKHISHKTAVDEMIYTGDTSSGNTKISPDTNTKVKTTETYDKKDRHIHLSADNTKSSDYKTKEKPTKADVSDIENIVAQKMNEQQIKVQSLEVMIMKLENKLLQDALKKQDYSNTITRLENHILRMENDLLKMTREYQTLRTATEHMSSQQNKYLKLQKHDQSKSLPEVALYSKKNSEVIAEHQAKIDKLSRVLEQQIQVIDQLKEKFNFVEGQNNMLHKMIMNQTLAISAVMRTLHHLSENNIKQREENHSFEQFHSKIDINSVVPGGIASDLNTNNAFDRLDAYLFSSNEKPSSFQNRNEQSSKNHKDIIESFFNEPWSNWCPKDNESCPFCYHKSLLISTCIPFSRSTWTSCTVTGCNFKKEISNSPGEEPKLVIVNNSRETTKDKKDAVHEKTIIEKDTKLKSKAKTDIERSGAEELFEKANSEYLQLTDSENSEEQNHWKPEGSTYTSDQTMFSDKPNNIESLQDKISEEPTSKQNDDGASSTNAPNDQTEPVQGKLDIDNFTNEDSSQPPTLDSSESNTNILKNMEVTKSSEEKKSDTTQSETIQGENSVKLENPVDYSANDNHLEESMNIGNGLDIKAENMGTDEVHKLTKKKDVKLHESDIVLNDNNSAQMSSSATTSEEKIQSTSVSTSNEQHIHKEQTVENKESGKYEDNTLQNSNTQKEEDVLKTASHLSELPKNNNDMTTKTEDKNKKAKEENGNAPTQLNVENKSTNKPEQSKSKDMSNGKNRVIPKYMNEPRQKEARGKNAYTCT